MHRRALQQHLKVYHTHPYIRLVMVAASIVLVSVIILQLVYPRDVTLPRAVLFGESVGLQQRNMLAGQLQTQFESARVHLKSNAHQAEYSISELGADVDTETTTDPLLEYPLWQRIIPFSLLVVSPRVDEFRINFAGSQLRHITDELAAKFSYAPRDATVTVEGGQLVPNTAESGLRVTVETIQHTLVAHSYGKGTTSLMVEGATIQPARSDANIATTLQRVRAILDRQLVIIVDTKNTFTPDAKTKAGWLMLSPEGSSYSIDISREAVNEYLSTINDAVKVDAGTTTVVLLDGVEQSRSNAAGGAQLDRTGIVDMLRTALLSDATTPISISASMQASDANINYVRNYSSTEVGLRKYVDFVTSNQDIRIVVKQLDGAGWAASGHANETLPSASTYKLFVMLRVFDDINSGALHWDDPILDTTVDGCFERMIVPSTNPCAEEFIRRYDRNALTEYVHTRGFSNGTGFTFSDATHTTAGDLARYLEGLYNGTLISGNNRDMLLEKMSRQLYRYGVPTGSKGWVQDKVGFLWDYVHDAAIVHHPRGTYIIVVMTKGYSYARIAEITRQIESIMYP